MAELHYVAYPRTTFGLGPTGPRLNVPHTTILVLKLLTADFGPTISETSKSLTQMSYSNVRPMDLAQLHHVAYPLTRSGLRPTGPQCNVPVHCIRVNN